MNPTSPSSRAKHWARLRLIPLADVLRRFHATVDPYDPCKWHTLRGVLSLRGAQFFNWNQNLGGGGAIDLTIHLQGGDFATALRWLEENFPQARPSALDKACEPPPFSQPMADAQRLPSVRDYLVCQRGLPAAVVAELIAAQDLYADNRGNAVFLLRRSDGTVCGAELRGTRLRWQGMALGSRKDQGCFGWPRAGVLELWQQQPAFESLILCESAIDAISCHVLHPKSICISVAGARPNPRWLSSWVGLPLRIYCGFDADVTGETMAGSLMSHYPGVERMRPELKDWNDVLRFRATA